MGSKTSHKSCKTRSIPKHANEPNLRLNLIVAKQAAKKKHQPWSKDRSERVRDALDRDADMLYHALESPSTVPRSIPKALTDSVAVLEESMQCLGR